MSASPDSVPESSRESHLTKTLWLAPTEMVADQDGPPPLHYTVYIHRRERKILIWFSLLFIETGVLPLVLFFALRWGAHLSTTINLAILTSVIGSVSGYKFAQRLWFLWISPDGHTRRPIGAGRYGVDFFQHLITMAMVAFFVPLIIGSSLNPGSVSVVAIALPCVMLVFCVPMLITGLFPHHIRVPFRVSSLPAREILPPTTYTIVEDVVAVDGGGCTEFRQAWRVRYEASRVLRKALRDTALAWGISGTLAGAALIVVAFLADDDVAYGCGYGLPWLWAMALASWTYHFVNGMLRCERENWTNAKVHRVRTLNIVEGKHDPPVGQVLPERPPTPPRRSLSLSTAVRGAGPRSPTSPTSPGTARRSHSTPTTAMRESAAPITPVSAGGAPPRRTVAVADPPVLNMPAPPAPAALRAALDPLPLRTASEDGAPGPRTPPV